MDSFFLRLKTIVRRHREDRAHYASVWGWWLSIYNRLLIHLKRVPLPARGRVAAVRLSDVPDVFYVRLGSSDWYPLEEVFFRGEYQELQKLGLANVRQILDLGANVGMSIRLWKSLWPDASVVAVEPDRQNMRALEMNLGASYAAGVTKILACAGGRERHIRLNRERGDYAFYMSDDASEGEEVDVLTVPEICRRGGIAGEIDLLKCDVEGAEAEIFADCARWIARVRHFAVEVHPPYTVDHLRADLQRAGANVIWHSVPTHQGNGVAFFSRAADCNKAGGHA